jgi:uncharacterized membrane protein YbhN (UPF0104 family)
VAKIDSAIFAYLVAPAETGLAIALVLRIFSNFACVGGGLLSLVIWSTAEGLGGFR